MYKHHALGAVFGSFCASFGLAGVLWYWATGGGRVLGGLEPHSTEQSATSTKKPKNNSSSAASSSTDNRHHSAATTTGAAHQSHGGSAGVPLAAVLFETTTEQPSRRHDWNILARMLLTTSNHRPLCRRRPATWPLTTGFRRSFCSSSRCAPWRRTPCLSRPSWSFGGVGAAAA